MSIFDCRDPEQYHQGLQAAVSTLAISHPVIMPTDTVYGIGVRAYDQEGLARLVTLKQRDPSMPIGLLIGSFSQLDQLVDTYGSHGKALMRAFWPGPLSLILPHQRGYSDGQTVMVRMPSHQVALRLLQHIGPMAVSSANHSGSPAARTIQQAYEYFGHQIKVYLDGGSLMAMNPSTIVDLSGEYPQIRRSGPVSASEIGKILDIDPAKLEDHRNE